MTTTSGYSLHPPPALTAVLLLAVAAQLVVPDNWKIPESQLVGALTVAVAWLGVRRQAPDRRSFPTALAAATTLFVAGDAVWDIVVAVSGDDPSTPSFVDAFYLAAYGALIYGTYRVGRRLYRATPTEAAVDTGVLVSSLALLFLTPAVALHGELSAGSLFVGVYPLIDLSLIVVLVVFRIITPSPALLLQTLALVALGTADLGYLIQTANDRYWSGSALDTVFLLGHALLALAAHTSVRDGDTEPEPKRPGVWALTAFSVGVLTVVLLVLARKDTPEAIFATAVRAIVLLLILVRFAHLVYANRAATAAAARALQQLELVVDASPSAVVYLDADMRITEWNKAASRVFRLPRDVVLGLDVRDFVTDRNRQYIDELIERLATGAAEEAERMMVMTDANTPLRLRISSTGDGYVVVADDMSHWVLTEQAAASFGSELDADTAVRALGARIHEIAPFDTINLVAFEEWVARDLASLDWDREHESLVAGRPVFNGRVPEVIQQRFFTDQFVVVDSATTIPAEQYLLRDRAIGSAIILPLLNGTAQLGGLVLGFRGPTDATFEVAARLSVMNATLGRAFANILTHERDQIDLATNKEEMDRAAEIQRTLLPTEAPTVAGYQVGGACTPARRVAGDFFDLRADDAAVWMTLGDVMGKGLGGAMLMASVRSALRSGARNESVAETIRRTANAISDDLDRSGSFVSLFHGRLDLATNTLEFVDAGLGLAIVVRADGAVERLTTSGLPIGLLADAWPAQTLALAPGDALVVMSDGMIDLGTEARSQADVERVFSQLAHRVRAAPVVDDAMARHLTRVDDPDDDLTIVLLRRV